MDYITMLLCSQIKVGFGQWVASVGEEGDKRMEVGVFIPQLPSYQALDCHSLVSSTKGHNPYQRTSSLQCRKLPC